MKRHLFANPSLDKDGQPVYDIVYKNKMQSPEEVAKSKIYRFVKKVPKFETSTNNERLEDIFEKDWVYGYKRFVLTYGPIISQSMETNERKVQFAGYWE
jgi:hypothetical protein